MCGIFGWAGKDPKNFNRDKFDKLGIYNTSRGRDSCGFTMDGFKYSGYGNDEKDYAEYILKYGNNVVPTKFPIVIGHTRQASPGMAVNYFNIHPFGYGINNKLYFTKNTEEGTIKEYAYEMFFAHNGTLKNHLDLAKKYNIDQTFKIGSSEYPKTDSRILGEIIFENKNFNVLSEYIGAAACVFTNTKTKTLYMFRGESKEYLSSSFISEERPLFYYIENENSMYFSSIKGSLISIGGIDKKNVFELEANTVYVIQEGDMASAKKYKIDRENASQKEPIISYKNNAFSMTGVQTEIPFKNNSNYIFEKANIIPYELKASNSDTPTRYCQSMVTTNQKENNVLHFKDGMFHYSFNNVFTGIALNIEHIGLINIDYFNNFEKVENFLKKNENDLLLELNEMIKERLYFKIINNNSTEPICKDSSENSFIKFQTSKNLDDNEVEKLLKNDQFKRSFFILPNSLNFDEPYISDLNAFSFIVDGLVVNNYHEFLILLKKCIDSYKKENKKFEYYSLFTSYLDIFSINHFMKYYIISRKNSKELLFYDQYGSLLNEIIYIEGSPCILKFENGEYKERYYTDYLQLNIFITDKYKNKNSSKLKNFSNDIDKFYDQIFNSLKNNNFINFDYILNLKYRESCEFKKQILSKLKNIDFSANKDINNFINDKIVNILCNLTNFEISKITENYKLDEFMELINIYKAIVNSFLEKDNRMFLTDKEEIDLKEIEMKLISQLDDLEYNESMNLSS